MSSSARELPRQLWPRLTYTAAQLRELAMGTGAKAPAETAKPAPTRARDPGHGCVDWFIYSSPDSSAPRPD